MHVRRKASISALGSLIVVWTITSLAAAHDHEIARENELAVPRSLQVKLEHEGSRVPAGAVVYRVQRSDGGRLHVECADVGYPRGWVAGSDVVPLDQAIVFFTSECRSNQKSSDAYLLRGAVHHYLGNIQAGTSDMLRASEIDPNLALPHVLLASAKFKQGDYAGALQESNEALRLDSHLAAAFVSRAQTYYITNRLNEATADLTEAIRLEPMNGFLYSARARFFKTLGFDERATADIDSGLRLGPETWWAQRDRGERLNDRNEWELAVSAFDAAIRSRAQCADAFAGARSRSSI